MKTFKEYLQRKQLEMAIAIGRQVSDKEFAASIDTAPTTYSSWVNGGSVPEYYTLIRLADKLGEGVFEAAGYIKPKGSIYSLPPSLKAKLESFVSELGAAVKDVPDGSEEQARIVRSLMDKFGFTSTENIHESTTK